MTDANYSQLVKLHDEYNSQGFEILAFPCNQFAAQEPVSDEVSFVDCCGVADSVYSTGN
jgi:glutathione peroxidase-family protein